MRRLLVPLALIPVLTFALPAAAMPPGVTCKNGQVQTQLNDQPNETPWHPMAVCQAGMGGADVLRGSPEADNLWGMDGNDFLSGGNGADVLKGGTGNDSISDGNNPDGNGDVIDGGGGFNVLYQCANNAQFDVKINIDRTFSGDC